MQVPENMAGSGFPRVWLAAENPDCVCAGSPVRDRLFKRTEWFRTDDRGPWPVTATEFVPPSPWIAAGFSLRTEVYTPLKVLSP